MTSSKAIPTHLTMRLRLERLQDAGLARPLLGHIQRALEAVGRPVKIMEVCGTHTVALRKSGIHSLLPQGITLVSGPGCPVCVTPSGYIDNALALIERHGARLATFGDMIKVPGSPGASGSACASLARHLGSGKVRVVYSPAQLPALASESPSPLVFLGIGFETTAPGVASIFLREGLPANLSVYTAFKRVVPALAALLASADSRIDAFLLPGHVSTIIGSAAYGLLEGPGGRPGVIAGFEPLDMLYAILLALRQIASGASRVENAYPRAVRPEGNARAKALIERLLEPSDELWRGLGVVPGGGLALREGFRSRDAAITFDLPPLRDSDPPGCLCGQVIQGNKLPEDCPFFAKRCTPESPVGPCMVSSEGTCAAHLKYA